MNCHVFFWFTVYIKRGKVSVRSFVRSYVRNAERGVNDVIMRMTSQSQQLANGDMAIGDMWPRVAPL